MPQNHLLGRSTPLNSLLDRSSILLPCWSGRLRVPRHHWFCQLLYQSLHHQLLVLLSRRRLPVLLSCCRALIWFSSLQRGPAFAAARGPLLHTCPAPRPSARGPQLRTCPAPGPSTRGPQLRTCPATEFGELFVAPGSSAQFPGSFTSACTCLYLPINHITLNKHCSHLATSPHYASWSSAFGSIHHYTHHKTITAAPIPSRRWIAVASCPGWTIARHRTVCWVAACHGILCWIAAVPSFSAGVAGPDITGSASSITSLSIAGFLSCCPVAGSRSCCPVAVSCLRRRPPEGFRFHRRRTTPPPPVTLRLFRWPPVTLRLFRWPPVTLRLHRRPPVTFLLCHRHSARPTDGFDLRRRPHEVLSSAHVQPLGHPPKVYHLALVCTCVLLFHLP
ncbi:uncharacterized protein LOC122879030 [Siniperca chuatsi]|uniref:uncharacterized protein LOC122879030 n=1 Tax=Siniperca chuatsi TaxID=119488 RepID=UPI001CE14F1F|nr:uncharacterized protein LOC122879030 [Siniperca chuatsi]